MYSYKHDHHHLASFISISLIYIHSILFQNQCTHLVLGKKGLRTHLKEHLTDTQNPRREEAAEAPGGLTLALFIIPVGDI